MDNYDISKDKKMKFKIEKNNVCYYECENKLKNKCGAKARASFEENRLKVIDYTKHYFNCKRLICSQGLYYF